jgi:hypothetical protein
MNLRSCPRMVEYGRFQIWNPNQPQVGAENPEGSILRLFSYVKHWSFFFSFLPFFFIWFPLFCVCNFASLLSSYLSFLCIYGFYVSIFLVFASLRFYLEQQLFTTALPFFSFAIRDIRKVTLSLGLLSLPNPSFSDIRKVRKFY